jgi:hypothetical protein
VRRSSIVLRSCAVLSTTDAHTRHATHLPHALLELHLLTQQRLRAHHVRADKVQQRLLVGDGLSPAARRHDRRQALADMRGQDAAHRQTAKPLRAQGCSEW